MKTINRMRFNVMRGASAAGGLALFALGMQNACADPWIPAASHGLIDPMLRYYSADNAFPSNRFGTSTVPASKQDYWQFRLTGSEGIGHRFSIEYDLRAAQIADTKHHRTVTATGLQDQEVGLNYGLTQSKSFADSLTLNIVVPTGSALAAVPLSSGHYAIEPDVQMGWAGSGWFTTLELGTRIFTNGVATQVRFDSSAGIRLSQRFELMGEAFLARTYHSSQPIAPTDNAELYNLLRLGGKLQYRLTPDVRPYLGFEQYVAGKGIHAGYRVTVGAVIRI